MFKKASAKKQQQKTYIAYGLTVNRKEAAASVSNTYNNFSPKKYILSCLHMQRLQFYIQDEIVFSF